MQEVTDLTFGQKAVGLNFNPSGDDVVGLAKQTCANAIDQMKAIMDSGGGERWELANIAYRKLQSAQMDMVKAITWKD